MNIQGRHVIVAGGSGFIGRALCRELVARGARVTVLTRQSPRKAAGIFGEEVCGLAGKAGASASGPVSGARASSTCLGLDFAVWDGRGAEGWGHLADGAYALVNLAGESIAEGRWTPERKRAIVESRVQAGRAMVEAVRMAAVKPEAYVQASGVGYYGDTGDRTVDESSPPGTGFLSEICLRWEDSTLEMEQMGVRRAVVRTSLVLGRGGGLLEKMLPPFRFFLGGPFGDGKQGFPWIHLEDEVGAIIFLLTTPEASGPFNLAAPEMVTNREFCRELARAISRPCAVKVPASALRAAFGEMADELFLAGSRVQPARLLEMGYRFRHPELAEALRSLVS